MKNQKIRRLRKRGQQSGTEAALLVLVITIAIVIYIMFLPSDERSDLLGDSSSEDDDDDTIVKYNITLIEESPGRIDYLQSKNFTHSIPSINLYTQTNAEIVETISPFIIKNNWFEKKTKTIDFKIDPEQSSNLQLSFTSQDREGTLSVLLNGVSIYEGEPSSSSINPITLNNEELLTQNELFFSVSEVGPAFWKTNKYSFENIMITADVTDDSGHRSNNIFTITETEYDNIDKTELKFYPECSPTTVGRLNILINGESVYSAVPDCGSPIYPIDVTSSLEIGKNNIEFFTDKGQILVDLIRVDSKMKKVMYPVYYFDLTEDQYDDIQSEKSEINLTLKFVDDIESKNAKLYVNGIRTYIYTKKNEFTADIGIWMEEGVNSVRLEPYGTNLEIRKLLVQLK